MITNNILPREVAAKHYFMRFTRYELSRFPRAFREVLERAGRAITFTLKRFQSGMFYEINYNRYGYNISVASDSLIELKSKFIEAVNIAIKTPENAPQGTQNGK